MLTCDMSDKLKYIINNDVTIKRQFTFLASNCYCQGYFLFLFLHLLEFKVDARLTFSSLSISLLPSLVSLLRTSSSLFIRSSSLSSLLKHRRRQVDRREYSKYKRRTSEHAYSKEDATSSTIYR